MLTYNYEAKNAAELKEKQPAGYALYEKHAKAGGKIGIRAGAFGPAGAAAGADAEAIRAEAQRSVIKSQIGAAARLMENIQKSSGESKDEKVKKAGEKIEQARKLIEEATKDLAE